MTKTPYTISHRHRMLIPVAHAKQADTSKKYKNEYAITGIVVLSAMVYWALAIANLSILDFNTVSLVWFPAGFALLAIFWLEEPGCLGVGLGAWCLNLTLGLPLPSSILMTLAVLLQALSGSWLLSRSSEVFSFKHLRDILKPIVAAALIPTLVGTTLTALAQPSGLNIEAWLAGWLGNSLGILATVPLALAFSRKRRLILRLVQQRWMETGLSLVFLSGLCWVVFLSPATSIIHVFHPEYLVLGVVLWMALRLGLVGTMLSTACVVAFSYLSLKTVSGPFLATAANHFSFAIAANQLYLVLMLASALVIATSETHLRAAKQHLQKLGRYMAPRLIDEVASLNLSPDQETRQTVAILAIEINGFANMVEHLTPEAILQIMREFHNRIGTNVAQHQGFIQSRTTDGLVAVFGASPNSCHPPSVMALGCARAMLENLAVFNTQQFLAGQLPFLVSIGVDYGTVILDTSNQLSNQFSKQDFMIAGKVVKTVTGLRDLCIRYQADICISQTVKDLVNRHAQSTRLLEGFHLEGTQRLLGFSEPITVWSLYSQMTEFYYHESDIHSRFEEVAEVGVDPYESEHIQSILNEAEQIHDLMHQNNHLVPFSTPKS